MPVERRAAAHGAANWVARYATVRNVGRLFGRSAMEYATEALWRRRRGKDVAMAVADRFSPRGATVVDVGASWGLFTYHLARRVGPSGRVYSFEPHPANEPMLRRLADYRRHVHFTPAAVSDDPGPAELVVPRQRSRLVTAQASLAHGFADQGVDVERLEVPTVRLDDALGPHMVAFVKIDVEGHESSVLRSGSSMLLRSRPPILIEIEQRHLAAPIDSVFGQLEKLGYQLFYISEHGLGPIADFDVIRDQTSLAAPDEFHPFAMPQNYIHDFCAVRTSDLLDGLPMDRRGKRR